MHYDVWDYESRNQLGSFASKAEALALVRELLAANPPGYAELLSLGYEDDEGEGAVIAEGQALAQLVAESKAQPRRKSA